jgi:hypothetical protein
MPEQLVSTLASKGPEETSTKCNFLRFLESYELVALEKYNLKRIKSVIALLCNFYTLQNLFCNAR